MLLWHKFLLHSSYMVYTVSQKEQSGVSIVSHRNVEKRHNTQYFRSNFLTKAYTWNT